MSGWIKWEKDLETDPRFIRLVRHVRGCVTGVTHLRDATVTGDAISSLTAGCLLRLWAYADTHLREDDTLDLGIDDVDELVGLPGFARGMPEDWLVELDKNRVQLPDFQLHNGVVAKKRALEQKRQARRRVTQVRDESVTPVTHLRDQTKTKTKTKTSKKPPPSPLPGPDWSSVENLNLEWWHLWLAHRRAEKRKPYKTTRSAQALARYPPEVQLAAIEQSMDKHWEGLFPEKVKLNGTGKPNGAARLSFDQHTERLREWLHDQIGAHP